MFLKGYKNKSKYNLNLLFSEAIVPYFCCLKIDLISKKCKQNIAVTCEDLTQPSEVEESTLGHGEELTQEDQKGDGREDH